MLSRGQDAVIAAGLQSGLHGVVVAGEELKRFRNAKQRIVRPAQAFKCFRARRIARVHQSIEFFLKLHDLWEGILAIPPPPNPPFDVETLEPIRTPPEFQWWKPEASDPAQFELQVPHWSPDFEFQDGYSGVNSA